MLSSPSCPPPAVHASLSCLLLSGPCLVMVCWGSEVRTVNPVLVVVCNRAYCPRPAHACVFRFCLTSCTFVVLYPPRGIHLTRGNALAFVPGIAVVVPMMLSLLSCVCLVAVFPCPVSDLSLLSSPLCGPFKFLGPLRCIYVLILMLLIMRCRLRYSRGRGDPAYANAI